MDVIDRVLAFWFEDGFDKRRKAWFAKNADFDAQIRTQFWDDVEKASKGEFDKFSETPKGALALMIFLDQFPRNIFREDPKAFATDAKALKISKQAIANGLDANLSIFQKIFFYLPFEHSENMDDQNQAVELCQALGDEDYLKYAIAHRNVIEKFDRFPHRNKVLGRVSTADEIEFLVRFRSF